MLVDLFTIRATGKKMRKAPFHLEIIALSLMGAMLAPVILFHGCMYVYQEVYFSIYGIPKVRLSDYLILDRMKLKGLNIFQRLGCEYCGYANALAAWIKAVVNTTETYSCAIKHDVWKKGQEHQEEFASYKTFTR